MADDRGKAKTDAAWAKARETDPGIDKLLSKAKKKLTAKRPGAPAPAAPVLSTPAESGEAIATAKAAAGKKQK